MAKIQYTYINLAIKSCSNLAIKCSYTIDNVKVNCRPKVDFSYLYIILFCTLFSQFSTLCASFMNLITILMGPQTSQCTLHWIILKKSKCRRQQIINIIIFTDLKRFNV